VLDLPLLLSFVGVFLVIPAGILAAWQLVTRAKPAVFEWVIILLLVFSSGLLVWQSR
jgi:hypothetical protein